MVEIHLHEKVLTPRICSVLVTRIGNLIPEHLAKEIQLAIHSSSDIAWNFVHEIQNTGQAVVFTGHPLDAELVVSSLKISGVTVELIDMQQHITDFRMDL